jgi:citrate lyase subunit beta/citryl-CoA lyase
MTPLFVPADKPGRFTKAAASEADAVIIDLEDAIAPEAKDAARTGLLTPGALPAGKPVILRINGSGTPWHEADLAAAAKLDLTAVMLPKTESVQAARDVRCHSGKPVIALIETAKGLAAARQVAASGEVTRLAFGSIDFCADLGTAHTRDALLLARSEIVLASRLGDLTAPLDGVTTSIEDAALIEDDARHAHELGFAGKLCIHPRQVAPARRGFVPSAAEIAWARRIIVAGEGGAVSIDGAMVDAPVLLRAQQILVKLGL